MNYQITDTQLNEYVARNIFTKDQADLVRKSKMVNNPSGGGGNLNA